jgi:hypothetical protein
MRHPEVEIKEVIEMKVRGSTRFQGKGVCENGKTWCKILKQEEIPSEYFSVTLNEEGDSMSVFEKGVEISQVEELEVEEPVMEVPVVEDPVREEPVREELVVEEPVREEPVMEVPVVEDSVREEPVVEEPVMEVPVVEDSVREEPVREEPVHEEPVREEPVHEEPVREEPVGIPRPMMPSEIETLDIPNPTESEDTPRVSPPKPDWEDEVEPIVSPSPVRSRPMRVRPTTRFPQRVNPKPSFSKPRRAEEQPVSLPDAAEIDRARKVGEFMGRSMFNAVGEEYVKYLRANWNKTKIPTEHFEYFEAAYLAGGAKQVAENKAEESQMDARTIAGIAGIGILAAWFASQVNNSDSP